MRLTLAGLRVGDKALISVALLHYVEYCQTASDNARAIGATDTAEQYATEAARLLSLVDLVIRGRYSP